MAVMKPTITSNIRLFFVAALFTSVVSVGLLKGFDENFLQAIFYISSLIGGIASLVSLAFSITRSLVALLFNNSPCRSLGFGSSALMISGCLYIKNKSWASPTQTTPVMEC
jgi:hypothetical protein